MDSKIEKLVKKGILIAGVLKRDEEGFVTVERVTDLDKLKEREAQGEELYYAGNIVIQKKDSVFVLNNSILSKLRGKNIKGRLVGCDDERVYIIEDKDISSYDIQDGKFSNTVTTLPDDQVLKSFYIFNDGYELIVMNKTNEQYISKNISVK